MSSPEFRALPLDRVFWQEEGWQKLSAHLPRGTALHSPPVCPPFQPKRTASQAGSEHPPNSPSTAGSSSSLQPLRRRKRARMSSHEEQQSVGIETRSSRIMMERISELSRRLSAASTVSPGHLSAASASTASSASTISPLHDKTNVRREEAKDGVASARSEKRGTRSSPVRGARHLSRTLSGPVDYKAAAPRCQSIAHPRPRPTVHRSRPLDTAKEVQAKPQLSADLADDELEGDDSFDLLLSQVPDIDVVFCSASPCDPKASQEARRSPRVARKQAATITTEDANDLCAGILEWSDLEEI